MITATACTHPKCIYAQGTSSALGICTHSVSQCSLCHRTIRWSEAIGFDEYGDERDYYKGVIVKHPVLMAAENAAAISDAVHHDNTKYQALYDSLGEQMGGFPAIWTFIAECAIELDIQHPDEWNDGWIEACQLIGNAILDMASSELKTPQAIVAAVLKEQKENE